MNCWKSMVLATTLLAVAAGGRSLNANDDDKGRGKNNDVPQSVTLAFGTGINTALPPPNGKPNHHILPGVTTVRVKLAAVAADVVPGVVNFVVSGMHQIFVYKPGTTPADIDAYIAAHDPAALFINDMDNLLYAGIPPVNAAGAPANTFPAARADRSGAQNRAEAVGFSAPGLYLVICNVRPHFQDGMLAWVRVVADDDDQDDHRGHDRQ
jgi:hypothetical protein